MLTTGMGKVLAGRSSDVLEIKDNVEMGEGSLFERV